MTPHQKYLVKSLTKVVELLDKTANEVLKQGKAIDKLNTEIEKIKNPQIESMFNMKRDNPFKEGTN